MTPLLTDRERLRALNVAHPDWTATAKLSALGRPNYGEEFAADVLLRVELTNQSVPRAIEAAYTSAPKDGVPR